jgi:hypothetical protein
MYRHDLGSMFYVLIWTTSRFHNGDEIALPPLQEWAGNDGVTVTEKKSFFVMMSEPPLTPQFSSFGRWVVSMQTMVFILGRSIFLKFRSLDWNLHLHISNMRHLVA